MHTTSLYDISDVDFQVPSRDEQAQKKTIALARLTAYIARCGGQLEPGWNCAVRFRVTTRSNGLAGVTTDNFYYSPTGETFRSHKQVANFLGLAEPEQLKQQSRNKECTVLGASVAEQAPQCSSAHSERSAPANSRVSCLSVPKHTMSNSSEQQPAAKRQRVTIPIKLRDRQATTSTFDSYFAAQAARSAAVHNAAIAAQAALAGPIAAAAAPPSVRHPASATALIQSPHEQQNQQQAQQSEQQVPGKTQPTVQVMPPPQQRPIKQTKAMLAAKYAAACSSASGASSVSTTVPCSEQDHSNTASLTGHTISSKSAKADAPEQQQQDATPAPSKPVAQQHQTVDIGILPCVSSGNSVSTAALSSAAAAPSSTECTASSPQQQKGHQRKYKSKELKPLCMQRQQQQQQSAKVYKPKKQPAWRANLRMLATQIAAGNGLGSSAKSSTVSSSSAATQQIAESRPASV